MRLADVGEFGLIARIARAAEAVSGAGAGAAVRRGIGHDAALLRARAGEDVAVSSDAFVEGVHFRREGEAARNVGRRLLVANLSDLAATGARPLGCTLSLAAPPELPVAEAMGYVRGLLDRAVLHGCPLVGGNVTRAREVSLSVTVLGGVDRGRALARSGARPGDTLWLTGRLGAAALARARSEQGGRRLRHCGEPRLAAGRALRGLARAAIDVSDGLLADAGHLAAASGVGIELEVARVPRPRGFEAACRRLGLAWQEPLLAGGEDYELLFALGARAPREATLERRLGVPVAAIGRLTPGRGLRLKGAPDRIRVEGWRHF